MPERIHHPDLPEEILVSYQPIIIPRKGLDVNQLEAHSGAALLKKSAKIWFSVQQMEIHALKNEKPRAFINSEEISVSFSHTNNALSAAISKQFVVGCDMEMERRAVHPKLMKRMKHDQEKIDLYSRVAPIRIWTFKESALKMIGTGLRKPMNSVKVTREDSSKFSVEFDDGKRAKICSFQHKEHWISICYTLF